MRRLFGALLLGLSGTAALVKLQEQQSRAIEMQTAEAKMKRALDTVDALAKSIREARDVVSALQRHQDTMLIWIVGLASSAVVGLPVMYNYILDLKSIPRWVLATPLLFFVLAVICGIVARLFLKSLMDIEAQATYARATSLEALRVTQPMNEEGRQQILKQVSNVLKGDHPKTAEYTRRAARMVKCVRSFEWLPYVLFTLGVIAAAVFVVINPS